MILVSAVTTSSEQRIAASPSLTFRDALGRGWRVDKNGRLSRTSAWTSVSRTRSASLKLPFLGTKVTVERPDG